jgi:hypothetical protein
VDDRLQRYLAKKEQARLQTEAALKQVAQRKEQALEAFGGMVDRIVCKQEVEKAERERRIREAVQRLREKEQRICREVEEMAARARALLRQAQEDTFRVIEDRAAQLVVKLAEERLHQEQDSSLKLEELLRRMERNKEMLRGEVIRRVELARMRLEAAASGAFERAGRKAEAYRQEIYRGDTDPDGDRYAFDGGGLIRGFGFFLSELIGSLLKVPFIVAEAITGSKFIGELGEAIGSAAEGSGKLAAQAVQGSVDLLYGTLTGSDRLRDRGVSYLKHSGRSVVRGAMRTARSTTVNLGKLVSGDKESFMEGARKLAISSVVVALPLTIMEGLDLLEDTGTETADSHFVEPHGVEGYFREDGSYVAGYWRDGDGNPLTDLSREQGGGYWRSDPDTATRITIWADGARAEQSS